MLPLLGENHRLPLFHMAKHFIWIIKTKNGYMIYLGLNVSEAFIEQVKKCMHTTFGEITQPFIKSKLLNIIQVC